MSELSQISSTSSPTMMKINNVPIVMPVWGLFTPMQQGPLTKSVFSVCKSLEDQK